MKTTIAVSLVLLGLACVTTQAAVIFDWITVGNPGNASDVQPQGAFGTVDYTYRISKHEVANIQYIEFLNAVDPAGENALGLFRPLMSTNALGGINFNGVAANGSKYLVKSGRENNPVVYVSFLDAMRFVNWLENGQASGSTESGVYAIDTGFNETRIPSARYFIPDENEWYKAAYHKNDGVTGNYWNYPNATDFAPFSDQPPGIGAPIQSNVANFFKDDGIANGYDDGFAVTGSPISSSDQNYLTDVGVYPTSLSPYGTSDQGGNVVEWTETVFSSSFRILHGGNWQSSVNELSASHRAVAAPTSEGKTIGFRVASIAAPDVTPDFNSDGSINCADVDSLVAEIAAGTNSSRFDLTGDGFVNTNDLDEWRVQAGAANLASGNPYLVGDANLDGHVDALDFIVWRDHRFTPIAAWCSGDFNADGLVDGQDFIEWNNNKFASADSLIAIPEPWSSNLFFAAMFFGTVLRTRRREGATPRSFV